MACGSGFPNERPSAPKTPPVLQSTTQKRGVRIQTELAPQRRYMRVLNICWLGKKHRATRVTVNFSIEQLVQCEGMIRPQNAAGRLPPARFRRAREGFDLGEELGSL